jgi:hypothetical protein
VMSERPSAVAAAPGSSNNNNGPRGPRQVLQPRSERNAAQDVDPAAAEDGEPSEEPMQWGRQMARRGSVLSNSSNRRNSVLNLGAPRDTAKRPSVDMGMPGRALRRSSTTVDTGPSGAGGGASSAQEIVLMQASQGTPHTNQTGLVGCRGMSLL